MLWSCIQHAIQCSQSDVFASDEIILKPSLLIARELSLQRPWALSPQWTLLIICQLEPPGWPAAFQRVTGTAFWAQVCLQFFPSFCSSFTVAFSKEAAWSCIAQSISEESPCICLPRSTGKWPSLISDAVGVYWWIGLFHDKYLPGNSYLIREFLRKIQLVFSSLSWVGAL